MSRPTLDRAARAAGGRIVAALAARFRDLDVAEEAFADACSRAAEVWPRSGEPRDPAAWLYRVALQDFLPYHAVRADLLRRAGRAGEARAAYDAALALHPAPAERLSLERRRQS